MLLFFFLIFGVTYLVRWIRLGYERIQRGWLYFFIRFPTSNTHSFWALFSKLLIRSQDHSMEEDLTVNNYLNVLIFFISKELCRLNKLLFEESQFYKYWWPPTPMKVGRGKGGLASMVPWNWWQKLWVLEIFRNRINRLLEIWSYVIFE